MVAWAGDKRPVWERVCARYGGRPEAFDWGTWQFLEWSLGKTWTTVASSAKARRFGWRRVDDTGEAWIDTFKTLASAGVIPGPAALRSGDGDGDGDDGDDEGGDAPELGTRDGGAGLNSNGIVS